MKFPRMQNSEQQQRLIVIFSWLCLFLLAVFAYWPGFKGPFMLDDYGSIAALANHGGVVDWQSFKAFVFGGGSGPTGRPVSLLTFLIDGTSWPADPQPFKRTNVVIHLMTGTLLGILIRQVLVCLQMTRQSALRLSFVSAAIWILHPFLVSTTLYVVQRMAQLATLFMLAGLVVYMRGRVQLPQNPKKAYWTMSLALPFFTLLAMLSKENGILLPVLAGVLELTVIASQRERVGQLNRAWVAVFIVAPTVVIFLYLGRQFFRPDFFDIVPPRDFSLYERMLTEARVLLDYLQNWFIPKLYTTGVFQDHVIKSTGIFSPLTTVAALVFHIAAITLAFVNRRKRPLIAFAVLFFYAGHLIESTVLNLELYFEHRNYLPAGFLFVPLVVLLHERVNGRVFLVTVAGVFLMLSGFTRYSATVWQSASSIVEASAHKAPTSARAQARYSNFLFNANMHDKALQVVDDAIVNIPHNNTLLRVNRLILLCNTNSLSMNDVEETFDRLSDIPFDPRLLTAYNEFAKGLAQGRCPSISIGSVLPMFVAMLDVPENSDDSTLANSHIHFLIGYINVYRGAPEAALSAFKSSLHAQPGASHAMAMAALMASSDYNEQALQLSQQAKSYLGEEQESMVIGTRVQEADILEFEATIRADLEASPTPGTADESQ